MDRKIQLKHPHGKKPISMESWKYNLLRPALMKCLRTKGKTTFSEMAAAITKEFKTTGTKFEGSIPWHLEWVKMDLEARKVIKRIANTTPQEYTIARQRK